MILIAARWPNKRLARTRRALFQPIDGDVSDCGVDPHGAIPVEQSQQLLVICKRRHLPIIGHGAAAANSQCPLAGDGYLVAIPFGC